MIPNPSMKHIVNTTEVQHNLEHLLARLQEGNEHLVIEQAGDAKAAMISMKDYDQFRRLLAEKLHKDLGRRLGAEIKRRGITEEQLIEMMEEDREAVYKEFYG